MGSEPPVQPAAARPARRLIVNADDFGRSAAANAAIVRAHREGILTTTSLMVNEPGCAEAVALARENPRLGVGLHLTLLFGHSALPPERLPGLVDARGEFSTNPAAAGCRYFFLPSLRQQLRAELEAQFERFRATGLPLDHVNGHLHLHLHPTILSMVLELAERFGVRHMRLTRDPLRLNLQLASGHLFYRLVHALVFGRLSARALPVFRRRGIRFTERVFGLLQNAQVNEPFVLGLLARLPAGDSELYSHPSLDEFKAEFDALISPRVRELVGRQHIQLIRYQDL